MTGGPELASASVSGWALGALATPLCAWAAAAAKALGSQRFNSIDRREGAAPLAIGAVSTLATQAGRPMSMTTRDFPGSNRPKRNALTIASERFAEGRPTLGSSWK